MNSKTSTNSRLGIVVAFVMVFLLITSMHSYYYLNEILAKPSENWGRDMLIKSRIPHRVTPSVYMEGDNANVLIGNGDSFKNITINRKTAELKSEDIVIKDARTDIVARMLWNKDYIFWTENYDLYYSVKQSDGSYGSKILLADNVRDYNFFDDDETYLIVADNEGLFLFEAAGGNVSLKSSYELKDPRGVDIIQGNNKLLYVAACASPDNINYNFKYLTYDGSVWKQISDKNFRWVAGSVYKVEIALDDTDAYIFFQYGTMSSRVSESEVFFSKVPLAADTCEMEFEKLMVLEGERPEFTFVCQPEASKTQGDKVQLAVIKDVLDKRYNKRYGIYQLTIDNGKVIDREAMIREVRWVSRMDYCTTGSENVLVYLIPAGKFDSEVHYTDNGKAYVEAISRARPIDVIYAFFGVLPGYINSIFFIALKTILLIPSILWIVAIEILEVRKLKKRPYLILTVAIVIHIIVRLFAIGVDYTDMSMTLMPDVLKFSGAPYVYVLAIAAVSILISRLFKSTKPDMSHITQFVIFAASDLIINAMLYTGYIY
ncbi:MAG: hypothetical protein ACOZCL_07330 [Bacillota bacterium]